MNSRVKKGWHPSMSWEDAYQETSYYYQRCQDNNLFAGHSAPYLYQAYILNSSWSTEGFQEISKFFKFSHEKDPNSDFARAAILKLLIVALKCHYFTQEKSVIAHEPFVFTLPDISQLGKKRYGLVYPLEFNGTRSTIIVSEYDVVFSSYQKPYITHEQKFPCVIEADNTKWLNEARWKDLKEESENSSWFDNKQPWKRKKLYSDAMNHENPENFPYGTVLEPNYSKPGMNEELRYVGAIFGSQMKRWFLPKGFDIRAVKSWLEYYMTLTDSEKEKIRWWYSFNQVKKSTQYNKNNQIKEQL